MDDTKILVIGKRGQLSQYFCANCSSVCTILSSSDLNMTETNSIKEIISKFDFNLILNLSSYNDVEKSESSQDAQLINSLALKELAEYSNLVNVPLIHISTDYVFDGTEGNYSEEHRTNPINIYGRSKLAGEDYVRKICKKYLILRTSWLYSSLKGRSSFLNKAIEIFLSEKKEVYGAIDSVGSPTSAFTFAEKLNLIIPQFISSEGLSGTFHYANTGRVSRYEFLKEIFINLESLTGMKAPKILPVENAIFNLKALRPDDTSLDTSKIHKIFKLETINWIDALKDELKRLTI